MSALKKTGIVKRRKPILPKILIGGFFVAILFLFGILLFSFNKAQKELKKESINTESANGVSESDVARALRERNR